MGELEYNSMFYILNKSYDLVFNLLAAKMTKIEGEWGLILPKATIFYLDKERSQAVKISSRKFFGYLRKVELTDGADKGLIGQILKIDENIKDTNQKKK